MNADSLLAQVEAAPRFELEVRLILDPNAYAEARRLNDRLATLHLDGDDVTVEGVEAVVSRLHEIHRNTPETVFRFAARTAAEWEAIQVAHADPTDFALELFAQSCVEPDGWDRAKARKLYDTLTAGQWAVLLQSLLTLNEGLFDLRPTRAATALMRGMRPSSITVQNEEYPDLPS
jgi:hypothetical protein